MIKIIPFKVEHFYAIKERTEVDNFELEFFIRANVHFLNRFPSITAVVGETYIACAGFIPLWPNTAELWARVSPEAKPYKIEFNQIALNFISDTARAFRFTRLQATVDEQFMVARRWVEFLGFHREGLLQKYFNDRDYLMFSRTEG
jgi:RimJ/RimL family protein N-acetyltransferase